MTTYLPNLFFNCEKVGNEDIMVKDNVRLIGKSLPGLEEMSGFESPTLSYFLTLKLLQKMKQVTLGILLILTGINCLAFLLLSIWTFDLLWIRCLITSFIIGYFLLRINDKWEDKF